MTTTGEHQVFFDFPHW